MTVFCLCPTIPYVPLSLGQLVGVITPIIRPDIDPQSFFLDITMSINTGLELLEGQNSEIIINEIFNLNIFAIFNKSLLFARSRCHFFHT